MKNFCEDFFLESTCACVIVPWPWPQAFLFLASRVSVLGKAVLGLGLGFFLCPWPWPRAMCPLLHLWQLLNLVKLFVFCCFFGWQLLRHRSNHRLCQTITSTAAMPLFQVCAYVSDLAWRKAVQYSRQF